MVFTSFEAILLATAFLVRGFIWSAMLSLLVPRAVRDARIQTVEFLTLSCINYGLWSWLLFLLFQQDFYIRHPYWTAPLLFLMMLVSPVVLGLLAAWCKQRKIMSRLFGRFGFDTVRRWPSAWDYHFSREQPYWVIVTFTQVTRIYGFFGLESFAGEDAQHRDLYLEAAFEPQKTGEWAPVEETAGVWIAAEQIASIEFRTITEVNYDRKND